jgi:hypothetical protein
MPRYSLNDTIRVHLQRKSVGDSVDDSVELPSLSSSDVS